jgi:hypothetical protein
MSRTLIVCGLVMVTFLTGLPASVQARTERPGLSALRLSDVAALDTRAAVPYAPVRRQQNGPAQDSLKNGALIGMLVGALAGTVWYVSCGDVECGPVLGLSIAAGAALGAESTR